MLEAAINDVHSALATVFGEELITLYRYGSVGTPDYQPEAPEVDLWAIVADEVDVHQLRAAFLPVWAEHGATLRRPPLLARRGAFQRHLHFFPIFADHLARHGVSLVGPDLLDLAPQPPAEGERVAYLAQEAMVASAALAPELLSPVQATKTRAHLHRLAQRLTGEAISETTPARELFTAVQLALRALIDGLPGEHLPASSQVVDSAEEPNLQAVYQETDHTLFILPILSTDLLQNIDWERLTERLLKRYSSLQATTARQLRLILQSEAALEFALGRYEYEWGLPVLADLQVSKRAVWRAAARLPSRLLVDDVPAAYLTARDDEALHKVVHDYQNRLLNMRLQHELLHRLHGFEAAAPPHPLPGQNVPLPARVEAILSHLDWWADYYRQQMEASEWSQRLSAP